MLFLFLLLLFLMFLVLFHSVNVFAELLHFDWIVQQFASSVYFGFPYRNKWILLKFPLNVNLVLRSTRKYGFRSAV